MPRERENMERVEAREKSPEEVYEEIIGESKKMTKPIVEAFKKAVEEGKIGTRTSNRIRIGEDTYGIGMEILIPEGFVNFGRDLEKPHKGHESFFLRERGDFKYKRRDPSEKVVEYSRAGDTEPLKKFGKTVKNPDICLKRLEKIKEAFDKGDIEFMKAGG